jgi:hypothetical protein
MATQNVNFKIKNTLEVLQDGIIHGNTTLASDATAGNLKTIILGNATDTSGQYTDINIFGDVTINGSINSSSLNSDGSIFPSSTNTVYLGDSTKKWLSLYASTVNTNTLNVRNAADEVVKFSVDGTTGNTNISGSLSITGLTTINDCVINGNVTVNGTTTTLNTATMMVDDKNIELGSTAIPTDVSADGGGITLKGNTDKTILWVDANDAWTFNQNVDISSGFAYRIGNTAVLSSTTLGASVISSSLTSVGTLSSGTWNASIIAGQYGGTGVANTGKTITLGGNLITAGAFATTLTTTNTTNVTLPTSGTLATIAGTEILSGKTLTAPKIVNGGYVADANGNESIIFNTTASAVNEITVANASTGNNPSITASGTDVNVGINFIPKGTGKIQISGNEIATINSTQTLTNKTIDLGSNTLSGNVVTIGTTAITAGGTQLTLAGLTSVNGLSLTANTTGFSIAGSSKTLTINKSITLDGTDGTTITLPSSTGTVPLNDQTMYIGTTAVTINRASASLALTGISSIDGSASSLTTARTINGEPFNGSANINIEARLGTPIASATTTTIGTKGSGDTIHITGTATITSLGVSTTGTIRRLVFDGAVTLAHNATSLILPAGDSLTTFVGDVADFVCENGALGYWRCLNYAVANISQQEYSYLNGATSNIQTQLDTRLSKSELLMVIGNINSPLLDMPLKNSLAMKSGVGSATFTRASTATYIDRYGILKTAAIDEPRFEKEGYLNEGDSTNLLPYSEQFDNATWSKSNTTVTANTTDTTDPRGTNLADKLLDTASTTWHYMISPAVSFTAGTKYTFSIFAKKGTKDVVQLVTNVSAFPAGYANFDLTNGVISAQAGLDDAKISSLSNGWYRLSITSTANTTTTATPIFISIQNSTTAAMSATYLGDGTGSVYIFGAQLEALSFATSYIPTTTGTATRSTDLLNVTREGNMPNIEVDGVVSISTDFNSFGNTTSNQWMWGLYSSASNNIGAYVSPTGTVNSNAVSIADNNSTGTTNNIKNIVQRCTQTIDNNLHTLYINGTYKSSDAGTDKRITQTQNNAYSTIRLGSYDPTVSIQGYQFFGHISNFRIWDRALTALEVTLI